MQNANTARESKFQNQPLVRLQARKREDASDLLLNQSYNRNKFDVQSEEKPHRRERKDIRTGVRKVVDDLDSFSWLFEKWEH